ncbi:hypothetical protein SUGI_0005450, partial [Cryptomeria japonica]
MGAPFSPKDQRKALVLWTEGSSHLGLPCFSCLCYCSSQHKHPDLKISHPYA